MLRLRDYKPGVDPVLRENGDDLYVLHQGDYRVVHVLGTERSGYIMSYFFDEDGLVQTLRITEDGAIEGCENNVVAKHDDTITFASGSEILMSVDGIPYYAVVGTDGAISLDIALMVREDGTGDVTENVGVIYPDLVRLLSDDEIKYFREIVRERCGEGAWRKYFAPKPKFKPFNKVLMRNREVIPAKWFPVFFSHEENGVYYDTSGISFTECIPYEGNETLALTDREP